jgi:hypothetical protein
MPMAAGTTFSVAKEHAVSADHVDAVPSGVPEGAAAGPLFSMRQRLGDILVARGLITEEQLTQALAESRSSGELVGRVLLGHQWLFEDELARALATQLGLPYVSLSVTGIDRDIARMLPLETGMRAAAIPIGLHGGAVRVAFADPCDELAEQAVRQHLGRYEPVVAELSDIESAWRGVERAGFAPTR